MPTRPSDVGQLRDPLDGVVAVGALVVRHGDAVRHVAAAGVLHDHHEAGLGEPVELAARLPGILGVRRPLQQRRAPPSPCRPIDVGAKDDAVAHPRLDVLLDDDAVRGRLRVETATTTASSAHVTSRGARRMSPPIVTGTVPVTSEDGAESAVMLDRARVRVFLVAFLGTFVVIRAWLWFTPNADFDVAGYNVHHLFTGVLVLTASMLPLALGAGTGGRPRCSSSGRASA